MAKGTFSRAGLAILFVSTTGAYGWQSAGPLSPPRERHSPEPLNPAKLRVDSSLVLIPVHVTSIKGGPVNGLTKEDFALFQDGVRQDITHFAQDDAPISAGVL